MVSLKWDFHNWVTVVLMVAIAYAGAGLIKSIVTAGPLGGNSAGS